MALPPAVQAQLEAAEATLQRANTPQGSPQQTLEEVATQPTPQPEPVSIQPEPPAPAPAPAPAPTEDAWESRYKTLQGLFNKQSKEVVPELQRQVQNLSSQLQEAINRLNEVKDKQEAAPKKAKVDAADVEAFGQELVEMVHRVMGHGIGEMQSQLAGLNQRLSALEGNVQGATQAAAATAEELFFARLTEKVPSWEEINSDPAFLAWLNEIDPILDAPRGAALTQARQALNANRVIAIFSKFIEQNAPASPPPKATTVEKQVSPKASAATPPPAAPHKPILTQAQVKAFYDEVRRGVYRDRPDEARRLEAIVNEALAEGRVR